jgi:hypothetical protein
VTVGVEVTVPLAVAVAVKYRHCPSVASHTVFGPVYSKSVQPENPAVAHTEEQSPEPVAPSAQPAPPVLHVLQLQQSASRLDSRPTPATSSATTTATTTRPLHPFMTRTAAHVADIRSEHNVSRDQSCRPQHALAPHTPRAAAP